jgi:hypothetical protein
MVMHITGSLHPKEIVMQGSRTGINSMIFNAAFDLYSPAGSGEAKRDMHFL